MGGTLPSKFKVGLVQMSMSPDPDANLSKAIERTREVAKQGANLVCLPELFRTHYIGQREDHALFDLAEAVPGPTTDTLGKVAKDLGIVIIASLFERRAAGLYHNTAAVLDADGTVKGIYRKMHIPDDPSYYEKFYFTPGDLGFRTFDTKVGPVGTLVCWDQWYPEGARLTALAGAEVLFYPTAIGWDRNDTREEQDRQRDAWITVQRGHAVANGLPLLACNRVGFEASPEDTRRGIEFWGSSFVAGPQGELLASAGTAEPELLVVDVDMKRSEAVRRIWPFLRDRRVDAYGDLLKRFRD